MSVNVIGNAVESSIESSAIAMGFDNPVFGSQSVFRKVLKSMSEPGVVSTIDCHLDDKPEALNASAYAIALTLFDHDTCIFLSESLNKNNTQSSLGFHCATRFIQDQAQADFILCDESEIPTLAELNIGTEEYPDQSCTVIIQVKSLVHYEDLNEENDSTFSEKVGRCVLTGAGIEDTREIASSGLTVELIEQRKGLLKLFPLGIDLIFCAEETFFCLPRTTLVKHLTTVSEEPCM